MLPDRPANTFSRGRAYRAQVSGGSGRAGRCIDLGMQEDGRGRVSGREARSRHTDGHHSHADGRRGHTDHDGCGSEGRNGFDEDQDTHSHREKEVTHMLGASASGYCDEGPVRDGGAFLLVTDFCRLRTKSCRLRTIAEDFEPTAIANRRLPADWETNCELRTNG